MPRPLTRQAALHDDVTSQKHARDKAENYERKKIHYAPEPATEVVAGAGIVPAKFTAPTLGFSFRMRAGSAEKTDAKKYTQDAIAMARDRARYIRTRIRDGRPRRDYGRYKCGAVSLVTTLPPWAVGVVQRIGPSEGDDLMLRLAEAQAQRIAEISGRPVYGGGVHYDTAVPHWHLHIPKTASNKTPYPKSDFRTGGKWLAGTYRIDQKFPGLLAPLKKDRMQKHIEKKGTRLVDLQANRAIDAALEKWIRERGLWARYQADCEDYAKAKRKEQQREPDRRMVQAALGYHARSGVWPLAYRVMTLGMWRMIPREIRAVVMISIRATQIIRNPVMGSIGLARTVAKVARPQPEMSQPPIKMR